MARIPKKNTKPELVVRRLAHRLGYRFRLHRKDLPGSPDLVFVGSRKVIFVHGCFWHRHDCYAGRKIPSQNLDYWMPKFERNVERDAKNISSLRRLGWGVMVVWECGIAESENLERRLKEFLG